MSRVFDIRHSLLEDRDALEQLYPAAFPDEELRPLVRALLAHNIVSLVAIADDVLIGHAVLTPCQIDPAGIAVMLLGPIAVLPDWQKRGVGVALIEAGCARSAAAGANAIFVLGDPAYYGRFGFAADDAVTPPYSLPDEWAGAWQSRYLADGDPIHGTLIVPEPWQDKALWAP